MGTVARLAQQILGAAADDLLAEGNEGPQHVEQRHLLRLAAIQRHHVAAERGLQRRVAIKLVEDHLGIGIALQLDDDPVALTVGLVAQIGNALDALVAHQFGHLLDHRRLVHLIGNFGDDDLLAVATHRLDRGAAAHDDRAAAGLIGRANAGATKDQRAGREIRTRDDLHQLRQFDRRIVDQRDTAVDDFDEIVRRNVGRHADGDAACAVDQQVRELGRDHDRLGQRAVIVVAEIDRFLVEIVEQRMRGLLAAGTRCNVGPPAGHRRSSRNCPDRRSAAVATTMAAPCGPARHRSPSRHADGIYPSRHR